MKYTKVKNFDNKVGFITIHLKMDRQDAKMVKHFSAKYREVYTRYCVEQVKRICNGVPMVYPQNWYYDQANGCIGSDLSSASTLRILIYGFDTLLRNQAKLKKKYHGLTSKQAYQIVYRLKRNSFEYDPKNQEIVIPHHTSMTTNLFHRKLIRIPKIGKFKVSQKDIKKLPEGAKLKMIRVQYHADDNVTALITYADNSKQVFDEEGFMRLLRKDSKEEK